MGFFQGGKFNETAEAAYTGGAITVGTSQILAAVTGTNMVGRQELLIYNKSAVTIFFGPSGVTTATGIPIESTGVLNLPFGDSVSVYLIAGTAGNSVIVQEVG